MEIVLLPVILGIVFLAGRRPVFESVFATILVAPLLAFVAAQFGVLNLSLLYYLTVTLAVVGVFLVTAKWSGERKGHYRPLKEIEPLLIFVFASAFFHSLNQLWPDFMPMGERLRDYAIISSVVRYPLEAREPWMSGAPLVYYLYWYRFCHFLASLFDLEVWQVYARIQVFVCSLYLCCGFVFFRKWIRWSVLSSAIAAIIITIGSNAAGVRDFLTGDLNWWGPSRVVKGAINEFPAWSFLLGDDHPHFLNLPFLPFLVLCGLAIVLNMRSQVGRALVLLVIASGGAQWVWYANAWELPAFLALCGASAAWAGIYWLREPSESMRTKFRRVVEAMQLFFRDIGPALRRGLSTLAEASASPQIVIAVGVFALISWACLIGTSNITTGDLTPRFVSGDIARTSVLEMIAHWGLPLLLLSLTLPLRLPSVRYILFGYGAEVIALCLPVAWPWLTLLLILAGFSMWRSAGEAHGDRGEVGKLFLRDVSLVLALILIIAPEIFYFDDSYGAEIERMNTIFKFYSAAWFFAHVAALTYCVILFNRLGMNAIPRAVTVLLLGVVLVFSTGFFFQTAKVRRSPPCEGPQCEEGLAQLDREHPGAAAAIRTLRTIRPGVVLEAQGGPYSLTTHVATLSGHTAYLGWANHINLLTKMYDEVGRRERMTKTIYEESHCERVRTLLHAERIDYLVVGPLERKAYAGTATHDRSCLPQVMSAGEYSIFYSGN